MAAIAVFALLFVVVPALAPRYGVDSRDSRI